MNSSHEALRELTGLTAPTKSGIKYNLSNSRYFEKGELSQEEIQLLSQMAQTGIASVFKFCLPSKNVYTDKLGPFNEGSLRTAMRRFVAVAWMLHSEMLTGESEEPLTLDQLGKLPQLDCTKVTLSLSAKRFGDSFGFHSRMQKRKSCKENYAGAAKTGWEKRRAREAAANG
jgi:hypothetical protein